MNMLDIDSSSYCSICMTHISDHASTVLQCQHRFHTHCYTTFLAHNVINKKDDIQCPMCRDTILQIIVHSPTNIHIVTNMYGGSNQNIEDNEDNEDNEVDRHGHNQDTHIHTLLLDNPSSSIYSNNNNNNFEHNPSQACTLAVVSLSKMLLICFIMYVSFLFIRCGMGVNNMLCSM